MLSKIRFKKGVVISQTISTGYNFSSISITFDIKKAMLTADRISISLTQKHIVITSCLEGEHGEDTLHPLGDAFDFRSYIYTVSVLNRICDALREQLGKDYDVVIEKDHVHVEYDPEFKVQP